MAKKKKILEVKDNESGERVGKQSMGLPESSSEEGEGSSVAIVDWWIPKLKEKRRGKGVWSSAMDGDSWTRATATRLHYIDNKQTRDEQLDTCVIKIFHQLSHLIY